MEPQGRPLTPGTSYGPPSFNSAQNPDAATFLINHTLKSSCSPNVSDGLMSAKDSWDHDGEEDSEQQEGAPADPGSAQRKLRSSAFPSSLSWDSDSEKEMQDEEELQHFSNPHGLAAHSPGSPSSGLRLDSEQPEGLHHLRIKTDFPSSVPKHDDSTKTEEPNTSQLGPNEHSTVWNVSEPPELFLAKAKPKDGCQKDEEADKTGEKGLKGKEMMEPERDVYSFPGDSDPESPPPAPWAHCTFIQRCRKKRVLLRPFSGLGTLKRTLLEPAMQARVSPQKSKPVESAQPSEGGGIYDFEEPNFGVAEVAEATKIKRGEQEDESEAESKKEIFTCVECSIYFKKQVHLQEHIVEHCQSGAGGSRCLGKGGCFRCKECGWNLPNRLALSDHHRRHQESRRKILEEIEKLNENGKGKEIRKTDSKMVKRVSADPAFLEDASKVSSQDKESDSEIVSFPFPPPEVSSPDKDLAVLDSDTATPNSFRAQARAASSYRRRFICTKCNFSTRTSQALANHTKTHNRKKTAPQGDCPSSGSPSRLSSTSLACGFCAFVTSSQTVMREHQRLVHPGGVSLSRAQDDDDTGQHSRLHMGAQTSDHLSSSRSNATSVKNNPGVTACNESTASDSAAARPASQGVLKCGGSKKCRIKGKVWTNLAKVHPRLDDQKLSGSEDEERDEDQSTELDSDCSAQEASSPVGVRPHTRARSHTGDLSEQLGATKNDQADPDVEKEGKVFYLRRRKKVIAASADVDTDDDDDEEDADIDEKSVRRFLSENFLDEDGDEIEDGADALKSVERKCPYCPDRFHNGIGLANHVRGHLNRVGVSYNVRHFISPEEVNAIEKKFSYQKKKKKVANFDPDTFSVMHCEFCSAGFDTRAGLSSHARAHLRDFGITNWDVTVSPIHILRELFSSRPDLVIPTAPPRSPSSSLEESEEEAMAMKEERKGLTGVKLKVETSEGTLGVDASDTQPSDSPQDCKKEKELCEGEEEEEAAAEDDEEEIHLSSLDGLSVSPGKTGVCSADTDGLSPGEDADFKVQDLKCEACGARCESRRDLSSHACSRLRQPGVKFSETNGATVGLLDQNAEERDADSRIDSPLLEPLSSENSSPSAPQKDEDLEDMNLDQKPNPLSVLAKATKAVPLSSSSTPTPSPAASPVPPHSGSPSAIVRKAPISSLLPVSSPLRSSEHKAGGIKGLTSNLSAPASLTTKPLWAPQENDAPLNLTLDVDPDKDIVCQLCGAWFETRKGLSSHARAHLRHFGVEYSESKGSPIDLLSQLISTEEFKHKASALQLDAPPEPAGLKTALSTPKQSSLLSRSSSSSSSSSLLYKVSPAGAGSTSKATSASSLLGPPAKRVKSSSMRVFRLSNGELMALPHSEPPKEIGCEFCGEYFENRKGLSSHARSHLRQMGITEWSVNGSPIDTLRDIITRRGLPCALPLKPLKTPPPSSPGPPRSPLSTSSSPSANLLGRLPFTFAHPSSAPQPTASKSSSAPPASPSGLILKLKPEPVQVEVTSPGSVGRSDAFSGEALNWSSSESVFPLNLAMAHESEPSRDIRCEFCGEYFENRKGLSSHARSHLRQMGITEWSVNGSPIDTLREVMHKRGAGASSQSVQGVKKESSPGANSPPWENTRGTGSSEGSGVSGYKSSKFRKSFSLLQSGLRLHKPGLGSAGASAAPPGGKFFRMSPLGKRPLSEEAQSAERNLSPPQQHKTFSPLPRDFSFKRKPSPDKHGHQDPSCELCGFFFENRKALASHARAHLRQFGVTEWSVNGSPIETLSAWIRSRPQKVLEMHRSYMQGNRTTLKKKGISPLAASKDSDHILPISSQKASSSSAPWPSSLAVSQVRSLSCEVTQGSSKSAECESGTNLLTAPIRTSRSPSQSRLAGGLSLQSQVAHSELNVRVPRGLERRPLKHPSCPDGTERNNGSPKPPRTGTVPALVPKPPSYPLVKLVGKFYTLKCRFCEVEFHGPLSVQEDWIRHLQQHILKMSYNKPAAPKETSAGPPAPADDPAAAPASTSTSTTPALTCTPTAAPSSCSPTPPAECAPPVTATETVKISEEQPIPSPTSVAPPTQTV